MSTGLVAALVVLACMVADLALIATVVVHRAARFRRERRRRALRARLQPTVLRHLLEAGPLDVDGLTAPDRHVVIEIAHDLSINLRGRARRDLARLVADLDVMADAVTGAGSTWAHSRARAMQAFGLLAPVAAQPRFELELGLRDHSPLVRATAVRALGRTGDAAATTRLIGALDGPRPVPAGLVARAVLQLGPDTAEPLEQALRTAGPAGRVMSVELLGRSGAVGSLSALVTTLRSDPEAEVRVRCARALGLLQSPRGQGPLVEALRPGGPEALRTVAAGALGRIGDPRSVEVLAHAVERGPDAVANRAATALVGCGPSGQARLDQLAATGGRPAAHAREALARHAVAASVRGGVDPR